MPTGPPCTRYANSTATRATNTTNPATRTRLRRLFDATWSYITPGAANAATGTSEADLGRAPRLVVGLEVLALGEAEDVGQDVAREALDLRVVAVDGVVVELPRVGDPPLGAGQLLRQLGEVLVRLQVRVRLRQREQRLERPGDLVLGLGLVVGRLRRHAGVAGLDHRVERLALVGGVALDGLDQVGDEVVAARQLDVDLGPGVLDAVPQRDQAVVADDDVQREQNDEGDDDDDDEHGRPSYAGGAAAPQSADRQPRQALVAGDVRLGQAAHRE